jgi:hypothetical protein
MVKDRFPIWFERVEGAVIFICFTGLYLALQHNFLKFVLLFIAIDLSIIAYAFGPKIGAFIYNLAHIMAIPLLLIGFGLLNGQYLWLAAFALVWLAHIGFDRMLGLGLKFPDSFHHTTLGMIGQAVTRRHKSSKKAA